MWGMFGAAGHAGPAGGAAAEVVAGLESQLFALTALRSRVRTINDGLGNLSPGWQGPAERICAERVLELRLRITAAEQSLDEAIGHTRRALATLGGWGG